MTCHEIARLRGIREKSAEQLVARARRKIRNVCGLAARSHFGSDC
jgi:DNA-directed RNA polymerase specialized sigma24 family protein